ncbi:MAG TPA: HEAT repeat domain-containing protein [Anaerolineae bacterium]
MKKKAVTFDEALASLGAQAAPTSRTLRALSGLDTDQLAEVQAAWPLLNAQRRAYVTEKMREMAEEDVELDFTSMFHFTFSDVDERVRLSSIEGLWEDETPSLIDPLVILLRGDPSPLVRAASATALGRFLLLGEMERISRLRRDQVYSALMGAILISPPDSVVYQHALESLAYTSNEEVQTLISDAYASENLALRVTAVFAMGRSGDKQYSDLVRNELNSVLPAMRAEAARACGELEVSEAVPELSKLVDDSDTDVTTAALIALGQIGSDEARHLLEHAAESDDEDIAATAEEALSELDLLHGDIKFSTLWFDELGSEGVGQKGDE